MSSKIGEEKGSARRVESRANCWLGRGAEEIRGGYDARLGNSAPGVERGVAPPAGRVTEYYE